MVFWHGDAGRKNTGGKVKLRRGKRKHELGIVQINTKIGKEKRKVEKRKNGNIKVRAYSTEFVNVTDLKTKKTKKVKILGILENKANIHYVRRLVLTKGAVIKTEDGNAKITSRPSQSGIVNAVKVE